MNSSNLAIVYVSGNIISFLLSCNVFYTITYEEKVMALFNNTINVQEDDKRKGDLAFNFQYAVLLFIVFRYI